MFKFVLGTAIFMFIFLLKPLVLNGSTTKFCLSMSNTNTIRARHKSCFLRPDTGPCRADIVQWYYDAKQSKCYRFFWGGCQGNGNKFETQKQCMEHCWLNASSSPTHLPYFCELNFDYGTCFGHYERWGWDKIYKSCKRYLYSGCGGNQNNFETLAECYANCVQIPKISGFNSPVKGGQQLTTCVPLDVVK